MIMTVAGSSEPPHTEYHLFSCALSPDGQWLVWLHNNTTWFAARLDGSRQLQWPAASRYGGECAWLPDSQQWVELVQTYQQDAYRFSKAIVHSTAHPPNPRKVIINSVADGILEGVAGNSLLVVNFDPASEGAQIRMTEFSLAGPVAKPEVVTAHPPQIGAVFGVAPSPARNQLAWVTLSDDRGRYALWLSNVQGKDWQQVGSGPLEMVKQGNGVRLYWPQAVQWTPDGTKLSFIYKNALWVVPVKGH